ncbi:MAG: nucleotide sugar dehydrogenase, partial [Clostridia bacterium]|nr:nucleotide sugar dehydrogenase [Clostridia bacterium]
SFLATKISFINEISNFCEKAGGNIQEIAKGIGLDNRIGPRFLHAGIGYGGSCFPKDVKALIKTGEEYGYEFKIMKATEEVNHRQIDLLLEKLKKQIPNLKGKVIAVWGLAFKPKTDDVREAPALKIIEKLLKEGAKIRAFDPVAMPNTKKILPYIYYAKNSQDAVKGADALIVATEWDEFRSVDIEGMKKAMKGGLILDGRNIYKK